MTDQSRREKGGFFGFSFEVWEIEQKLFRLKKLSSLISQRFLFLFRIFAVNN